MMKYRQLIVMFVLILLLFSCSNIQRPSDDVIRRDVSNWVQEHKFGCKSCEKLGRFFSPRAATIQNVKILKHSKASREQGYFYVYMRVTGTEKCQNMDHGKTHEFGKIKVSVDMEATYVYESDRYGKESWKLNTVLCKSVYEY